MFKRILLMLFLLITNLLITNHYLYAGWPINVTPEIVGRITDATTGKPIENVVVRAVWAKRTPSLDGCQDTYITDEIVISSTDGSYNIPSKTIFYIFFPFTSLNIVFVHPLYETKEFNLTAQEIKILEKDTKKLQEKDNKIHLDIQLLSLEEKYGKDINQMENIEEKRRYAMNLSGFFRSHHTGFYWRVLKKKNIKFDLEETLKKWDSIANRIFIYTKGYIEDYEKDKKDIKLILEYEKK